MWTGTGPDRTGPERPVAGTGSIYARIPIVSYRKNTIRISKCAATFFSVIDITLNHINTMLSKFLYTKTNKFWD
jgi:hypothetical protein